MKRAVAILLGMLTLSNLWAVCLGGDLDCDCLDQDTADE